MPETSSWWPQSPLGLLLFLALAIAVLYLGRAAAHGAIRALCAAVHAALGLAAGLSMSAHDRVASRNREVLLEMGRESAERLIEREFHRVNRTVARDLSGYPELHHKLTDQITRIDEDYREATEVPPSLPDWTRAVESIASISPQGDPLVVRILNDIKKTLASSHKDALREYRQASAERHRLLRNMLPVWRKLEQTLERVNGTIAGLQERAQRIDRHMEAYEQIRARSDEAVRMLSASSATHLVSSGLVLFVALLGGFINFHLIALPMSEMVGATSYVGPAKTSDIAALVIIATEVAMGLFLMESLRITRMFPVIGRMDDVLRVRMIWISLGILVALAGVEASLAYMRDLLAADREALTQSLAGLEAAPAQLRWIPSVGQMVMGFLLPFALAFAAIPLESFISSSRIALGNLLALALRALAASLEFAASLAENASPTLIHLYDFPIVIPLRLETLLQRERSRAHEKPQRLELPKTM
jgi:hypothetical protein